jgi:hypothetical protein
MFDERFASAGRWWQIVMIWSSRPCPPRHVITSAPSMAKLDAEP